MNTYTLSSITVALLDIGEQPIIRNYKGDYTAFKIDTGEGIEEIALYKRHDGTVGFYRRWEDSEHFSGGGCDGRKTMAAELRAWDKKQKKYMEQALEEFVDTRSAAAKRIDWKHGV
jgi:hypothetical protein